MKFRFSLPSLLLVFLLALLTAQACGPEFFPDVFVLRMRPDHPKEFAAGQLGVLLPTYPRADLAVAFRYLNGGVLSAAERAAYHPTYAVNDPQWEQHWESENAQPGKQADPANQWTAARAKYAPPRPNVAQERTEKIKQPDGSINETSFLNCNSGAFETAVATLQARAAAWGQNSPGLADWIKGQDAVFSNCSQGPLTLPAAAPANSSALLKADRAYQTAAAQFYGMRYADAGKAFDTIGQDADSPWRGIARYVEARCLVRQAFYSTGAGEWGSMASFDPALMKQAGALLQSLLGQDLPGISHRAVQSELDLVRIRIEPDAQLHELATALSGPATDPNYNQHLEDLNWYLNLQLDNSNLREDSQQTANPLNPGAFSQAWLDQAKLRSSSALVDWLITFQSPANEAKDHAIAEWKSNHEPSWLLAAIAKASEKDTDAPNLVVAAGQIKAGSPAWESFAYHRIRLLIALGRAEEARTLLDQTMPGIRSGGRESSANAWLGLRMRASGSLNEFLAYAPRKIIVKSSESESALDECTEAMKDPKRNYDCAQQVSPVQFSADAASFFNTQASLATLIESANSNALPQQLRTSLAVMAWVRCVLLKDDASAGKLFPLLPQKLQQQAGAGTGFHAVMTLLRNPGLRPYLDPGVQRSYSYDFVESYSDNWWCADWRANEYWGRALPRKVEPALFLTSAQRSAADSEVGRLMNQKSAEVYLGTIALDYANAHPDDQDVPESLYLVLRAIRYGCERVPSQYDTNSSEEDKKVIELRTAAARLLRQRYAANPWTKKAAPYVG